eukprot:gnl/MRDRNA2_/MRDRNA2_17875_c0_seq1.p1 gnl/MRDRNA2_/MRDRNA2_17875_c0~~gnl/MRDRNA2_/MRDRNA2_17875_c0_seq1.p1  ORF type:complete len:629 (+),score=108.53 gnl/MRDRNA2_/MRDRNA2_17875_c0_seq1:50-1888(+)
MLTYMSFLLCPCFVSFSLILAEDRLVRRHRQEFSENVVHRHRQEFDQISIAVEGQGQLHLHGRTGTAVSLPHGRSDPKSKQENLAIDRKMEKGALALAEAFERHVQQPEMSGPLPAGGFPIPSFLVTWLNQTVERELGFHGVNEQEMHVGKARASALVDGDTGVSWFYIATFTFSLLGLTIITRQVSESSTQDNMENVSDLQAVRGNRCWVYFCPIVLVFFCIAIFAVTLNGIAVENLKIQEDPGWKVDGDGEGIRGMIKFHEVQHPYERAFEAGHGVALSAAIAVFIISKWRHSGSVKASSAMLAQFAFRGATLAVAIAVPLELLSTWVMRFSFTSTGLITIDKDGTKHTNFLIGFLWYLCGMGIIPGLCEEFAKAVCIICGTLVVASVARDRVRSPTRSACEKCWCLLVESPHALMLVGLSVGSGFMIVENAGYLLQVAVQPSEDIQDIDTGSAESIGGTTLRVLRIATMFIRTILNIHPWLAALTAARVAQISYKAKKNPENLSAQELLRALAPAACVHGLFDFVLVVGPAVLAILHPPLFWFGLHHIVTNEWNQLKPLQSSAIVISTGPAGIDSIGADAIANSPGTERQNTADGQTARDSRAAIAESQ